MNKYIIVTYNVCNMGGGQLFVLRRALYLKNKGYEVYIVTAFDNGVFPLKERFNNISIYNIPETTRSTSLISQSRKDEIIAKLFEKVGEADNYYFESHTLAATEWAEIFSSKVNGRHFAYPLAEPLFKKFILEPGRSIVKHKYAKEEFYGNNSRTLIHIFGQEPKHNNFINIAFDESELKDVCKPCLSCQKKDGDYVITAVTRLDKLYIEPLIMDVKRLANKHASQSFVLIIAGGSNTGTREKDLRTKYKKSDVPNLNIIFTGYIIELGKDIFNMSDVFVGMGTAAINAISQKCISLNIDPSKGNMCSGIFGIDTNNFAFTENGKVYTILEKLEEIYHADEEKITHIKEVGRALFENAYEMNACFKQMDDVVFSLNKNIDMPYLHVNSVYRMLVRLLYNAKKNFIR